LWEIGETISLVFFSNRGHSHKKLIPDWPGELEWSRILWKGSRKND